LLFREESVRLVQVKNVGNALALTEEAGWTIPASLLQSSGQPWFPVTQEVATALGGRAVGHTVRNGDTTWLHQSGRRVPGVHAAFGLLSAAIPVIWETQSLSLLMLHRDLQGPDAHPGFHWSSTGRGHSSAAPGARRSQVRGRTAGQNTSGNPDTRWSCREQDFRPRVHQGVPLPVLASVDGTTLSGSLVVGGVR
jgi:hypothetical protein